MSRKKKNYLLSLVMIINIIAVSFSGNMVLGLNTAEANTTDSSPMSFVASNTTTGSAIALDPEASAITLAGDDTEENWDAHLWKDISGATASEEVKAVSVVNDGDRYIVGTKSGKIYVLDKETRSSEGWKLKAEPNSELRYIGVVPNSDVIYALGKNVFYISMDNGETWATSGYSLPEPSAQVESVLLLSQDELYVVQGDKGVYYTENGGADWTKKSEGLPTTYKSDKNEYQIKAKVIYQQGSNLYIGMGEKLGVFVSSNQGHTWESFKNQQGLTELGREVKSIFSEGNHLYIGSKDGVWQTSTDGGGAWEKIPGDIPYDNEVVSVLRHGTSLFALTKNLDIYEAKENDQSFKSIGTKPEGFVTSEAFAGSIDGDFLVIGTKKGSIRVKLQGTDSTEETDGSDRTAPVITLLGNATEQVAIGDDYTDQGVTVSDNQDTGLVATVTYTKDQSQVDYIDTSEEGTYIVHYNVSDEAGNAATEVRRTVVVSNEIEAETPILQWREMDENSLESTHTLVVNNNYLVVNKVSGVSNVRMLSAGGIWKTTLSAIPEVKAMVRVPGTQIIYLIGSKDANRCFYISRDGGESWINALDESKAFPSNIGSNKVESLSIEDENTLYMTVDKLGIYKTTDGGQNWISLNGNLPYTEKNGVKEFKVRNVWSVSGVLYAGLKDKGGIYRSEDSGVVWKSVNGLQGLSDGGKEPRDLMVDNNTIYMATKDGVWTTDLNDSEASWTRISGTTSDKEISKLLSIDGVLYCVVKESSSSNIYYYNEDKFKPFTNKPNAVMTIEDFADMSYSEEYFYVAHKKGFLKIAQDWDVHFWKDISGTTASEEVKAVTVINNGSRYIVGTKSGKIYVLDKETRLSEGWKLKADTKSELRFIGLAPNSDTVIYALGKNVFYVSEDNGETWATSGYSLPEPSAQVESALLLSADELYVVQGDKGVYYTENGGAVWTKKSEGLPTTYKSDKDEYQIKAKVIYQQGSNLYIGMGEKLGVYVSSDHGQTWQSYKNQQGLTELGREIKSFYSEGNVLYIGSKDGVWRTTEGMEAWEKIPGDIPSDYDVLSVLKHGNSFYALTKKEGIVDLYEAKEGTWIFKSIGTKPEGFVTTDAFMGSKDGDFLVIGTKKGSIRVKLQGADSTGELEGEDKTAPVITLVGNTTERLAIGAEYTDRGVTITDNRDTELVATVTYTKDEILVDSIDTAEAGTYVVRYNVSDEAGNAATEVTRIVIVGSVADVPLSDNYFVDGYDADLSFGLIANVSDLLGEAYKDTTAPVLTLVGNATVIVAYGASYTDTGVNITDNQDAGLVARVTYTKSGLSVDSINTAEPGTYIIHYNVSDSAGNVATEVTRIVIVEKVKSSDNGGSSKPTKPSEPTTPIVVSNTDVAKVVDHIKNASSTSIITVDVTDNKQAAKDLFEVIKGTDKTVTFTQAGIQWTFKGSDITGDAKAIDLTVAVGTLEQSITPNKGLIADKVDNSNVLVVSFANNGQLPGKATIKLKLEDKWLSGKDKTKIGIYYYNEETKKIENVASNLEVDSDGYIQFEITHNSDYIVTDQKLSVEPTVLRLAGYDRYETSIKVSQNQWTTSEYVVLATGENFPDALSAAPFAKQLKAPILLTPSNYLEVSVSEELKRLQVQKVYIIGGTGAISTEVESAIKNMNINTERIGGHDKYDTSLAIAEKMDKRSEVFLCTGVDFPDALSISSYAAAKGSPILLTSQNEIKASVLKFINDNKSKVYVIGGTGVIQDSVMNRISGAERIYGYDRYETNLAVLSKFESGFNFSKIYLATGENFPDALCGAALAGENHSPMILINDNMSDASKSHLRSKLEGVNIINVLGGEAVISTDTLIKILN